MKLNLETLILLAGIGQFLNLTASALVPRVLDWRAVLAPLPPLLRRMFWVYGVFIVLVIIGFATLSVCHAGELASGSPLARGLCAFIAAFWGLRLAVQFFVFDATPWLTNRWLKLGYHTLTAGFTFFTAVYTIAALQLWTA